MKFQVPTKWAGISLIVLVFIQFADYIALERGWAFINPGTIFGLIADKAFVYVVWVAVFTLLFVFWQKKRISLPVFTLIALGAISNLIERLCYGGAVDYFNIPLIPTFNLADLLIIAGLFVGLVDFFGKNPKIEK
ncbi:MAG: signal peptidase II [Candidatus Berkelbacteria bacterium]|nr:signal peptidase II [Candidatus Berkelbacteria bacterium]